MAGKIKTLIVDDEHLARRRVLRQVVKDSRFHVVGEAANFHEALNQLRETQPHLLFLDIEMPGLSGFELVAEMGALSFEPLIVFVTAHSSYALEAFSVEAIDYVRKPFDDDRFQKTLNRAAKLYAQRMSLKMGLEMERIMGMYMGAEADYSETITLKHSGLPKTVRVKDIEWIEAYGNYVKLHLGNDTLLYRNPLKEVLEDFNPLEFIRLNRFAIVNTRFVSDISYKKNAEYGFTLYSGKQLTSTRLYKDKVEGFVKLFHKP